jgi:hypothetical protein
MRVVSFSEFKAMCLALLETLRRTRTPIRVTRLGKPVTEGIPPTPVIDGASWIGSRKDSIEIVGDLISPANHENDWELLRD